MFRSVLVALAALALLIAPAHARHHRHHTHHRYSGDEGRPTDCYGIPWCGCWLAKHLGLDRLATHINLNAAIEWLHVGTAADGPAPGVIGVQPHHVFLVVKVTGPHRVLAISGNDGNRVRTRERDTGKVIAWRNQ
jgi:hypothetical protein